MGLENWNQVVTYTQVASVCCHFLNYLQVYFCFRIVRTTKGQTSDRLYKFGSRVLRFHTHIRTMWNVYVFNKPASNSSGKLPFNCPKTTALSYKLTPMWAKIPPTQRLDSEIYFFCSFTLRLVRHTVKIPISTPSIQDSYLDISNSLPIPLSSSILPTFTVSSTHFLLFTFLLIKKIWLTLLG